MRIVPLTLLVAALSLTPVSAQKRSTAKEPTFVEAIDAAKKASDAEEYGSAVTALQTAIRLLQKKQRTAILAALPKPDGFEFQDDPAPDDAANAVAASVAMVGLSVQRHYQKGETSLDIEVTANSPMLQMLSMTFANPALTGGEIVEYGRHKAMLRKDGDSNHELQILMHDKHSIRVSSQGLTADDLLKICDQAFVDRMEKPLGK